MGLTRRLLRVTAQEPEWVKEWVDSELVERVEAIEAQVERLDAERDRLETKLAERVEVIDAQVELLDAERNWLETKLAERVVMIEAQVEKLDAERDRLETKLAERVEVIAAQVEKLDAERTRLETEASVGQSRPPRSVQPPQAESAAPVASRKAASIDWARLALLAGFVLAGWALFGVLIYIALLLS
jgi:DNA-binding Xre family transcriptional regulator